MDKISIFARSESSYIAKARSGSRDSDFQMRRAILRNGAVREGLDKGSTTAEALAFDSSPDRCHLFVDEAGTPDIFDAKGRNNVGKEGCSRFFFLGMMEVDEPRELAEALKALRQQMIADPYFSSAPSFKPERQKTALLLHAKDDLPEVRVKVFDLLRSFGSALRFRAVVCDKEVIREREIRRRELDPATATTRIISTTSWPARSSASSAASPTNTAYPSPSVATRSVTPPYELR